MDRKFVVTPQTGTPDVQGLMAADLSTSPFNLMAGSGFAEFRDRFVAMMESLSLAFLILDQELNFQYISEKALPFFGGIKVGDSFTKSIIVTERVIAAYKSVLDTGRDFVLRDYQPADSRFPKINMQAMRFGERLIVFYENVDAIEQKEQLARRSEERFQLLSESVNMALIIVNQALEVTYWNPRAEAMTGVSVASAVGLPAVQLFPSLSTAFIERCKTSLREHTAFSIDRYAYTGIRGSYIFSIRAFPVADELAILIDDHTTLAQAFRLRCC
jgi:PAS domain S-box-containing protein